MIPPLDFVTSLPYIPYHAYYLHFFSCIPHVPLSSNLAELVPIIAAGMCIIDSATLVSMDSEKQKTIRSQKYQKNFFTLHILWGILFDLGI